MGFFLNMVFAAIKFVAKLVATIVEWAVTLDVPAMFGEQAEEIASRFHQAIGFDNPAANTLFRLALVVMFTVVFFRLVRGRTSKGLAEAGVSWVDPDGLLRMDRRVTDRVRHRRVRHRRRLPRDRRAGRRRRHGRHARSAAPRVRSSATTPPPRSAAPSKPASTRCMSRFPTTS